MAQTRVALSVAECDAFSDDEVASSPPAVVPLKINVSSGDYSVFLTLTSALLQKSLEKAVVTPFIKAYNKKRRAEESSDTISSIKIRGGARDGTIDHATARNEAVSAGSLLGAGSTVEVHLTFAGESFTVSSATTLCTDLATGLLALRLSAKARRTAWCFADTVSQQPAQTLRTERAVNDATRAEFEATAVEDFAVEGGHCGRIPAVAGAWRTVFVRRRLMHIVRGARSALLGRRHDEAETATSSADEARSLSRKKDAPGEPSTPAIVPDGRLLRAAWLAAAAAAIPSRFVTAVAVTTVAVTTVAVMTVAVTTVAVMPVAVMPVAVMPVAVTTVARLSLPLHPQTPRTSRACAASCKLKPSRQRWLSVGSAILDALVSSSRRRLTACRTGGSCGRRPRRQPSSTRCVWARRCRTAHCAAP